METGAGQIGHGGSFGIELLDVVFAEIAEAELVCLANGGGGKDFGDGEQQDGGGVAVGAAGGAGDALAYYQQSFFQTLHAFRYVPVSTYPQMPFTDKSGVYFSLHFRFFFFQKREKNLPKSGVELGLDFNVKNSFFSSTIVIEV
jgi:hypothetical protein